MNIFLTGAFFLSYGKNVRYISVRFCEYLKIRVAAMRAFFGAHYCAPFLICQFGTVRPDYSYRKSLTALVRLFPYKDVYIP